jgi:AhpD family alkylhydroperoxidase
MTPNMMKFLAASPAALGGYLSLSVALASGTLEPKCREQIGLAVAQANNSDYCLSRHTANARKIGMTESEIADARQSRSDNPKTDAGLKFAIKLVIFRGQVKDADVARVRAAGYSDAEIVEVVANVALDIFSNYFNHVAEPEVESS